MSLIPFILDLADELQEYQRCLIGGVGSGVGCAAMDIDDVDFGLQSLQEAGLQNSTQQQQSPQQQQQQQQQQTEQARRPRLLSQLYWPSNILQKHHQHRHHPYAQTARLCCSGKDRDSASSLKANSIAGLASKPTAYPVINKNGWMMVSMNVKQFTPDELIVKTIDNCIIVEGRHEDKEDIHGVISRHFIRKYMLPKGYDPNEVVSTLSSDGILTVKAPPPVPPQDSEEATERIVDIQQTGPAQTAVKQTTPPPPPAATAEVAAADEVSLEPSNLPTDTTTTPEQAELNITDECETPLEQEQAAQLEGESAMQTEHSIEIEPMQEEPVETKNAKDEEKCDVVVAPVTDIVVSEDLSGVNVNAVATTSTTDAADGTAGVAAPVLAAEDLEPQAVEMATENLAESAKPEMQIEIVAPAETAESAELLVNSSAASVDVPMIAAEDVVADVVAVAATSNANDDDGDESKVAVCNVSAINNDNETQPASNNGIDVAAATIVGAATAADDEIAIPVTKTTATVLPTDVPASLDLGVCLPKSVVIDAAAAAAAVGVKETVTDAGTAEEKNGVEANGTNGSGVDGDNGLVVGVAGIDTLPTAAEELVAN